MPEKIFKINDYPDIPVNTGQSVNNNAVLTGIPTAPTAPQGTNTDQVATTAFVLANGGSGGSGGTATTNASLLISGTLDDARLSNNVALKSYVTKVNVGLGDVDNTADLDKPVSTATQTALDLKANLASPTFTGTVSGISKAMVGLGNVDNTADVNKPVSTAIQTALDLKANLASPTFTGTPTLPTGTVGVTQTAGNSTTAVATTAFVTTANNLKANLASPTFTGTPAAPTAAVTTNTTQVATTAFVQSAVNINPISNKTAAYTVVAADNTITADATSAAFNITLLTAVGNTGRIYTIKKIDSSVNIVTVATTSSQTIDGATTYPLTSQYSAITVQSNGTNWVVIAINGVGVTAPIGTNNTQLATTAFVQSAFATLQINTRIANYTTVLSDAGKLIQMNLAGANTLTVPLNSAVAYPIGTQMLIRQMGAGQTTITPSGAVVLESSNGLKTRVQFASVTLVKVATDTWMVSGDLTV